MLGWGTCKRGYNPAMSEEIGVREDVSVTLELSLAESQVSHVKVRERWEWCFRKREQCTQAQRGEGHGCVALKGFSLDRVCH